MKAEIVFTYKKLKIDWKFPFIHVVKVEVPFGPPPPESDAATKEYVDKRSSNTNG